MFGIRGVLTRWTDASTREASGLVVAGQQEEYIRRGHWTTRDIFRFALGGGGAGFEGGLFGSWAGGVRIPVGAHHGPVLRAGLLGYLRGNDKYYESLLELPQVQLGYQYMQGNWVLEVGGTSGAVLAGRSRTGDTLARELGAGFEFGGYAAVQGPWLRLGVSANSLPTGDAYPKHVQVFDGTLCALMAPFAICADARANLAQAITLPEGPASDVRWVQVGITVGYTREGERRSSVPPALAPSSAPAGS